MITEIINNVNPFSIKIGYFYFGWTGRHNLGDEALYHGIKKLLEPVSLVKYLPFYGEKQFIRVLQERGVSGFIMVAGTFLNASFNIREETGLSTLFQYPNVRKIRISLKK